MLLTGLLTKAQNMSPEVKSWIVPMTLDISNQKTSNLIFPYAIKSVDRGTKDVLVQKAKGVENVLQLKAATDTLKETNLTVVCADGTLYSFLINYLLNPLQLNLTLGKVMEKLPHAMFAPDGNNEGKTFDLAEQLLYKKPVVKRLKAHYDDVFLTCTGIYVKDDIFYLQFNLENNSSINYSIDQLRFFVRDQKRATRTASQELQIQPTYTAGKSSAIDAKSEQTIVVTMPKFTIPDQKVLIIQLMEKDGGRNMDLRVRDRQLMQAITL